MVKCPKCGQWTCRFRGANIGKKQIMIYECLLCGYAEEIVNESPYGNESVYAILAQSIITESSRRHTKCRIPEDP